MAQKPSIPKGTRDFSPAEVAKRNYIFSTIKTNFEKFGFQPIETPSFENSETLMGKYGEEGDRLIFKILNSGEYMESFSLAFISGVFNVYKNFYLRLLNNEKDSIKDFISKNTIEFELFEEVFNSEKKDEFIKLKGVLDDKLIKLIFGTLEEYKTKFFENLKNYHLDIELSSKISGKKEIQELNEDDQKFIYLLSNLVLVSWQKLRSNKLTSQISEKALRYDLTVPFARYVVQHQNEIEFPFKRYQIQPVWRADRPQKGRFREFYQCDADVVGSNSLWQEVELVQLYDSVFSQLGLGGVTIKINNRKILSGIAEVIGASDKLIDFTVALDKLDKIGEDGVKKEMLEKGISETAIEKVQPLFNFTGTINEKIEKLAQLLANSEEGMKGVNELQFICDNVTTLGLQTAFLDLDVTLARGLNYYTGAIFEVAAPKGVAMGSIGGGGRYDDLTGKP